MAASGDALMLLMAKPANILASDSLEKPRNS
jgi:hypothetical protein